jgi:hypothetical protein
MTRDSQTPARPPQQRRRFRVGHPDRVLYPDDALGCPGSVLRLSFSFRPADMTGPGGDIAGLGD